jgi:hypothetical protein
MMWATRVEDLRTQAEFFRNEILVLFFQVRFTSFRRVESFQGLFFNFKFFSCKLKLIVNKYVGIVCLGLRPQIRTQ